MILEQGVHAGVHIDAYIRDPAPEPSLSTGTASALLSECPAAAWFRHPRLNPAWEQYQSKTSAQDIGTAAHDILLEGLDRVQVIDADDWRTKAAKEQRDLARADGKIPLLASKYAEVRAMVETAQSVLDTVKRNLTGGRSLLPERTLIFQDEGAWCRSRPDLGTEDLKFFVEYKTTAGSVHPDAFGRHIINMAYDLQWDLIRRGAWALSGETPEVIFLAQETSPPYLCSLVGLSPMFADMASRKLDVAIERWKQCVATNRWPSYPSQVAWVEPPSFEMAKVEMLE